MDPQAASNMSSLLPMKFRSVVEDAFVGIEAFVPASEALETPTRRARINVTRMGKVEKSFMVGSRTVVYLLRTVVARFVLFVEVPVQRVKIVSG